MKKIILIITTILLVGLTACTSQNPSAEELTEQQIILLEEIKTLKEEITFLQEKRDSLNMEVKENSDDTIYIFNLKVGVDRFALDFDNKIKDAFNEFSFEIIVSKEYYDSFEIGERLNEKTRIGSLVLNGSYGKQYIEVIDKRME